MPEDHNPPAPPTSEPTKPLRIGMNRWNWRSPAKFVESVVEAEKYGIDMVFQPSNPLAVWDPYALMAVAAAATTKIGFGPLLETPMLRPAPIAAGSIATLDAVSNGRAMLTYGIGDTAVRYLGKRPAKMAELRDAVVDARALLADDGIDVGKDEPARMRHARPVPVWIAAGGPKTLRMAGGVADGVFLRVGVHPANVRHAVDLIQAGARDAGREPSDVSIGLIVHTTQSQDPAELRAMSRCMAAGFYEYSPALFDPPGFVWPDPPIAELQHHVHPDFHHTTDHLAAGALVDHLSDEIAESFSLFGTTTDIANRVADLRREVPELELLVLHPVPNLKADQLARFARWAGEELRPLL